MNCSRRPPITIRAAWLYLLTASALALLGMAPAAAQNLQLTLAKATPEDSGVLKAAREAARQEGGTDLFKIKADFWIENNGPSTLAIDTVTIAYPGTSIPSVTSPPVTPVLISPSWPGIVPIEDGIDRQLPLPLPPTVDFTIAFVGTQQTFQFSFPLAIGTSDTPSKARPFPLGYLGPEKAWAYYERHVSVGHTQGARYAYDLVATRWNGSVWTALDEDANGNDLPGTENSHYVGWEQPVYAAGHGKILACRRSRPDDGIGGGNELWIQYGDRDLIYYTHFQQWSIPDNVCPENGPNVTIIESKGLTVVPGQVLGKIGNSGNSSYPHLHISAHVRLNNNSPYFMGSANDDGRPLEFSNIQIASDPASIQNLGEYPNFHESFRGILPSFTLIRPDFDPDYDNDGCGDIVDQHPTQPWGPIGTWFGLFCNPETWTMVGSEASSIDTDGDGIPNCADLDDDNDGLCDEAETLPGGEHGVPVNGCIGPDPCPLLHKTDYPDSDCEEVVSCPAAPWWDVCLLGGCNELFVQLVSVINPDPTAVFSQLDIVNQSLFLIPEAGQSVAEAAAAFTGVAKSEDALRLELWRKPDESGASARFIALIAEFEPTDVETGELEDGVLLRVDPTNLGDPYRSSLILSAVWTPGADPGQAPPDSDRDGWPDPFDDCRDLPDPSQTDTNEDGYGNFCDADFDDDWVVGDADADLLWELYGAECGDGTYDPDFDVDGDCLIGEAELELVESQLGGPPGPSGTTSHGPPGSDASGSGER